MNDKIKRLQEEIEKEKNVIKNCNYSFGEPYESYKIEKEEYFTGEYSGGGIDRWPVTGFRDKEVFVWERKCKTCGFIQQTTETEPVITSYKPKFD